MANEERWPGGRARRGVEDEQAWDERRRARRDDARGLRDRDSELRRLQERAVCIALIRGRQALNDGGDRVAAARSRECGRVLPVGARLLVRAAARARVALHAAEQEAVARRDARKNDERRQQRCKQASWETTRVHERNARQSVVA